MTSDMLPNRRHCTGDLAAQSQFGLAALPVLFFFPRDVIWIHNIFSYMHLDINIYIYNFIYISFIFIIVCVCNCVYISWSILPLYCWIVVDKLDVIYCPCFKNSSKKSQSSTQSKGLPNDQGTIALKQRRIAGMNNGFDHVEPTKKGITSSTLSGKIFPLRWII